MLSVTVDLGSGYNYAAPFHCAFKTKTVAGWNADTGKYRSERGTGVIIRSASDYGTIGLD